jgi:hypothetical protein
MAEFRDYFEKSGKLPEFNKEEKVWNDFEYDHLTKLLHSSDMGPELKFVKVRGIPVNISACTSPASYHV